jgi:formyl-CoA transferase
VELPLSDVTVLDLGQVYGGPYCSHLLRHLGARVIKIEPPHHGEPLRGRGRTYSDAGPVNFQLLNGGKESVTLDLKAAQDRDTFLQLCDSADVIVENFAPGTMDRLGLDYASVIERNPAIVYASLKAYSNDSPSRDARGMDLTVQASSGIMSVNGFPDAPPVKCGPSLVDFLGGTHLALGVLAALMERRTTRRGQQVSVSLQDSVIPTMASNIAGWLTNPIAPLRTGNHHGGMAECPYNSYATNDGYVAILCLTGVQWADLCDVMQRPDLRADATLVNGAYTTAVLMDHGGWGWVPAVLAAGLVTFVVGLILSVPALRLGPLHLGLVTLTFAVLMPLIATRWQSVTGGTFGLSLAPVHSPAGLQLSDAQFLYIVTFAVMMACLGFAAWWTRGRTGRALAALRSNPIMARTQGVDTTRLSIMVFTLATTMAGLGGALNALVLQSAIPDSYPFVFSLSLLTGAVVGGVRSWVGAVIGGAYIVYVPSFASELATSRSGGQWAQVINAALLLTALYFAPAGLAGIGARMARLFRRRPVAGRAPH